MVLNGFLFQSTDHIWHLPLSVPFVWNLTLFHVIVQLVQIMWLFSQMMRKLHKYITSTVPFVWNLSCFLHYCSTCSNYVTLPQMVKNFNICKHNVYFYFSSCMELDLLHYIWCEILLEYWLGCNIEYLEYLSVCIYYIYITYIYMWSSLFQIIPHLDGDIYCTLHFKIYVSILKSIEIYKCKLWHLLWGILAKT